MEYTYGECLDQCLVLVKRYQTARKVNKWNRWEFQEIRDDLSEALVFFGPHYADLRADAEQAEVNRKLYYEDRKEHWREHYGGARGTAGTVESKSMKDSKAIYSAENDAKRAYYKAKHLVERIDQTLNGIASRLKLIEKHDQDSGR